MHYENKVGILRRLRSALKPGGRILMTDYCRMEKEFAHYTQDFIDYAEEWDYFLVTVDDHTDLLERAGFGMVKFYAVFLMQAR